MKRVALVLISLALSWSSSAQIEGYIQSCRDTSEVYANWLSVMSDAEDYLPKGAFHYEVIKQLEANGNLVYTISDARYQHLLDSTRVNAGKKILKRSSRLDSIAEERAIRMVNIIVDENAELRSHLKGEPGKICHNPMITEFGIEAHNECTLIENALIETVCGGKAGLFSYPIGVYDSPEASLATFYTHQVVRANRHRSGESIFAPLNVNNDWNTSPGHYRSRISEDHKEYGYAIAIVEYTANGRKPRLIIAYEVFDTEIQ
jgi:hypothetical protein